MDDGTLNRLQTDMAEMKGMLSVVIANHSSRLDAHETHINNIYSRQNATNGKIGEQSVSIINIEKDIIDVRNDLDKNRTESKVSHDKDITRLETKQTGQVAKAFAIITPIIAVIAFVIGIGDKLWGG